MAAKKGEGSRAKLRAFFLEHVGEVLQSNDLRAVAATSEWARRVRELRNEEGMNIVTHNDRSELKPGEYILVDLKPLPAFERSISKETRAFVLDRNGYTCQMCGAVAGSNPVGVIGTITISLSNKTRLARVESPSMPATMDTAGTKARF